MASEHPESVVVVPTTSPVQFDRGANAGWLRLPAWSTGYLAHRIRWALRDRAPKFRTRRMAYDRALYRALFDLRQWRCGDLILDVGANDGRTILRLRRYLPRTRIIAFEPIAETFDRLCAATAGMADVTCHRLALGATEEDREMYVGAKGALNSLYPGFQASHRRERVPVTTLDRFIDQANIDRAELLKIDTEGHDLEVLRGAERTLRDGRFGAIQIEAGFDAPGTTQPSLERIRAHLAERGYYLWAIHNQCRGPALARQTGRTSPTILTYCDALFVHERADTREQASPKR